MRRCTIGSLFLGLSLARPVASIVQTAAVAPANEHFQHTWNRTDQPVATGQIFVVDSDSPRVVVFRSED